MSDSGAATGRTGDPLRKFRRDLSFIAVGLFLALAIQNLIQFVSVADPHISPYFYLGLGMGSIVMVLVSLNLAAKYAGVDQRSFDSSSA